MPPTHQVPTLIKSCAWWFSEAQKVSPLFDNFARETDLSLPFLQQQKTLTEVWRCCCWTLLDLHLPEALVRRCLKIIKITQSYHLVLQVLLLGTCHKIKDILYLRLRELNDLWIRIIMFFHLKKKKTWFHNIKFEWASHELQRTSHERM